MLADAKGLAVTWARSFASPRHHGGVTTAEKLQNVMAVTDFLALFWQLQHN
jgi:hypothetical protein